MTRDERVLMIAQGTRVGLVSFKVHANERGSLVAIEGDNDLPFSIRRVYYIYGVRPDVLRGAHAHKDLKQLLVAVSGSVTVLCDDGERKQEYILNRPDQGLLIEGLIWREMKNFTPDCVLLVLASKPYNRNDYIYDYGEFKLHMA